MAKNAIQFQPGLSLAVFLEQCRQALCRWRWPEGFVCPACGHRGYCEIHTRPLYQCNRTIIGHVKNALHGTDHHISAKHLPRYLAGFCDRFNRRFERLCS